MATKKYGKRRPRKSGKTGKNRKTGKRRMKWIRGGSTIFGSSKIEPAGETAGTEIQALPNARTENSMSGSNSGANKTAQEAKPEITKLDILNEFDKRSLELKETMKISLEKNSLEVLTALSRLNDGLVKINQVEKEKQSTTPASEP